MSPGSQSQQSIAYKGEPHSSPPNGSEVRPKKVDSSTTHPGSLVNTNRPPAGTKVLTPAPKEDTLDCLGSTIHEQAPGNVYQGSSTSSWGVKAFPRIARDCGSMPPGRDTPHQYKPPVGHHYGHPPPGREHHHWRYRSPPPLSHITQWDMANFHHTTPTMENVTAPQGPGHIQLQQAPGSYHGSQSCPSSGYPALSETHYHPSQVLTHAQRSTIEHYLVGGTNAGPYHPTGCTSTHNPVYPPGYSAPLGHGDPPQSASRSCMVNTLNPYDP